MTQVEGLEPDIVIEDCLLGTWSESDYKQLHAGLRGIPWIGIARERQGHNWRLLIACEQKHRIETREAIDKLCESLQSKAIAKGV